MDGTKEIPEFRSSPALLEKLHQFSIKKFFPAGSIILRENAPVRSIPILISGRLKIIRTDEDGKEILLYYLTPGESCIMSILSGLHHQTSKIKAEADQDAEILFLPVEKMYYFLQEFPQWTDYIFRLYHKRFEELLETIESIAFKNLDERLIQLLKKKKALSGKNEIFMTHEQIAQELGSSRVVISRLLKQMEQKGWIKLERNKITLCN
jgi:CRP/FNR family transcriptional regulator